MLLLFTTLSCGHRNGVSTQSLPVWQSSPLLANNLGHEVQFQGYSMKIPHGYSAKYGNMLGVLQPIGLDMYFWHNDDQAPNASGITLNVIHRINSQSPDNVVNSELELDKQDMGNFVHSKIEDGKISGIIFARAYWQGTKKTSSGSHVTSGFTYATVNTMEGITITGYDKVPCTAEPCTYAPIGYAILPSVEAAILTLRKK